MEQYAWLCILLLLLLLFLKVFKFQANKFNFRFLTGVHGGIHNNEYGGTLEYF